MYKENATQEQRILGLLSDGEWVDGMRFLRLESPITQYHARIWGLQKKGYRIVGRYVDGKNWKEYKLIKGDKTMIKDLIDYQRESIDSIKKSIKSSLQRPTASKTCLSAEEELSLEAQIAAEDEGLDEFTGVTTILGIIGKPGLIPWAVKMATDYIAKNSLVAEITSPENILKEDIKLPEYIVTEKILEEARTAHTRTRDKAGDIGTLVHECIEDYINRKAYNPKISKQAHKMVNNFRDWATDNKVEFLGSEQQVYSEKYFYAGTFDFLCMIAGKTYLGDIKTGSGIYPEMFFQCAAYQIAHEEMTGARVDGTIIVNLKKDGTITEKRSISNKTNKEAFLAALTLYRAMNKVAGTVIQK